MKERIEVSDVKIRENSFLARLASYKLRSDAAAIVFGNTVHLWNISKSDFLRNSRLLKHELAHVRQYQQFGFIGFICRYLLEWLKNGYHKNRFEVEARLAEEDGQPASP